MFAEMEAAGQTFADRKLCGDDYAAGGGFPIALRGTGVIGSICVSGFDDHLDDHQLVINTLAEYLASKSDRKESEHSLRLFSMPAGPGNAAPSARAG